MHLYMWVKSSDHSKVAADSGKWHQRSCGRQLSGTWANCSFATQHCTRSLRSDSGFGLSLWLCALSRNHFGAGTFCQPHDEQDSEKNCAGSGWTGHSEDLLLSCWCLICSRVEDSWTWALRLLDAPLGHHLSLTLISHWTLATHATLGLFGGI